MSRKQKAIVEEKKMPKRNKRTRTRENIDPKSANEDPNRKRKTERERKYQQKIKQDGKEPNNVICHKLFSLLFHVFEYLSTVLLIMIFKI